MNKRQLRKVLRKAIINEMAKGPSDGSGGYKYREDKSQFDDARTVLKEYYLDGPDEDVSRELFFVLMDIFSEAFGKGMSQDRIAGVAEDAARDFQR